MDAIFASMKLMKAHRGKKLRQIVLDFRNAFFQFPVSPAEQRFFATRLKNSVYVWTRCVQGSRGAPLICGRSLALAMRLCFGLLEDGRGSSSTYVDDPLSSYIGTDDEQEEAICITTAGLLILGFDLAFDKAQDSNEGPVTWTSAKLEITHGDETIKEQVKDDIIAEVKATVDKMLQARTIPLDSLRTLAGQATCIASLLHAWRPFVSMVWAPLYDSKARCWWEPGSIWKKPVEIALKWMAAFLHGQRGSLVRIYRLADYLGEGELTEVVTDASPNALGGYLVEDGEVVEYFEDNITAEDEKILGARTGSSEGQQIWEALALLVALRLWAPLWLTRMTKLRVKSDSTSALIALGKLKGRSPGVLKKHTRELAIDVGLGPHYHACVSHTAGISNTIADALSRHYELPAAATPRELDGILIRTPEPRGKSWWIAAKPRLGRRRA
mgnify:CR=1 FL=1